MYFFLFMLSISIILKNPEFIAEHLPYLTDNERSQFVNGIEDIRKGLWDTSQVGINAILRKVMNANEKDPNN